MKNHKKETTITIARACVLLMVSFCSFTLPSFLPRNPFVLPYQKARAEVEEARLQCYEGKSPLTIVKKCPNLIEAEKKLKEITEKMRNFSMLQERP